MDIKRPHPTDLLDQGVRQKILKDVRDKRYDHVYVGTPCETYSALREQQPGPRPLRSEEEIMGLSSGLTAAEQKQLKEGNLHTLYSAQVLKECFEAGVAFTMENPEPLKPVSIFNTLAFKEVARLMGVTYVDFDQCRVGCEAKKPTRLLYFKTKHIHLSELRCNHEEREWKDAKGNTYKAPHERVAQRKRINREGKEEYASKALGNYPPEFCKVLARDISRCDTSRAKKAAELMEAPLP